MGKSKQATNFRETKMQIYHKVIAARLDEGTRQMLDILCSRESNISRSGILRQAIRLLFEQRGKLD
jgi:hypothetical protein